MADALPYCLTLLKRRLRSRVELEQALSRRGFNPEESQAALQHLEELKLVDDQRFAEAWVHTRDRLLPRGESMLRAELFQKGIAKEIIDRVLEERRLAEEDQPSELELAQEVARRKSRFYQSLSPEVRRRRLSSLLQRRGFSYEVIRRILDA